MRRNVPSAVAVVVMFYVVAVACYALSYTTREALEVRPTAKAAYSSELVDECGGM